jgi:hypothetical protein
MATLITKNSSTAAAVPGTGDLVQGELAVNVTDKKIYTKDSGGAIVKVVGSLGNQEANAVAITGGTISGVAGVVATDYQEFTASGTWTKPAGANFVYVEAIGGGGSGRRDNSGSTVGGGGGGGLFVSGIFRASDIGSSVTVTVGAGGLSRTGSDQNGTNGGNSTFGSHVTAYGGGAGNTTGSSGKAGNLLGAFNGTVEEMSGYYGGQGSWNSGYVGGSTVYGGAGGGAAFNPAQFTNGGTSLYGGNGGNGGSTATAGAAPGGGGGGGTLTSGAGGAGRIRVWTW